MIKEVVGTPEKNAEKGVYSKPQLIEYGKVEEITKGGVGSVSDLGGFKSHMG